MSPLSTFKCTRKKDAGPALLSKSSPRVCPSPPRPLTSGPLRLISSRTFSIESGRFPLLLFLPTAARCGPDQLHSTSVCPPYAVQSKTYLFSCDAPHASAMPRSCAPGPTPSTLPVMFSQAVIPQAVITRPPAYKPKITHVIRSRS